MPDQTLTETSVFTWSRERELVPVYERLVAIAPQTACIVLIEELIDLHRMQLADAKELLGALNIEAPGEYTAITIPDSLESIVPLLYEKEAEILEQGYLRLDPFIEDATTRGIMFRVSRRKARQIALLREIAIRCNIVIIVGHPSGPVVPAPPTVPPEMPPGVTDYIVQSGDTMYLIAQRYGISLQTLISANPQIRNPELIYPGEVIHIPRGQVVSPAPGTPGGRQYIIRSGDTIIIVAQRFGLSAAELIAFNPQLGGRTELVVGEIIYIPGSGAVG